jgi:enolase
MTRMISATLRRAGQRLREFVRSRTDSGSSEGLRPLAGEAGGYLERGWVIANHKLVSFHAAFISSVLSLPVKELGEAAVAGANLKFEVLRFMFLSWETAVSATMLYLSWHVGIAIHEMGHYLTAAKLTALNRDSQDEADAVLAKGAPAKLAWYARMLITIPWGKFGGVKKEAGNYAPDAPYNLAVAAAAPVWSGYLAAVCLPLAAVGIGVGLLTHSELAIYVGRLFLCPGFVGLLDRFLADRGKLAQFRARERRAAEKAARAGAAKAEGTWLDRVAEVKQRLLTTRMQTVTLADGMKVNAPWQFRNCAMGGRHTEKEYPESNISMQEGMFMPLSAKTYEDAQEMTVRLQTRLKEIIESAPGAKVMGVGLEGGIAPYVDKEPQDQVPEQRMWRMMRQAILDCEYTPGVDVAIALDPACSELENMYREETEQRDSVGMYRFWRDKSKVDMSRDQILELYRQAMEEDDIPVLSIEDGFGEIDHAGWRLMMNGDAKAGIEGLGDKIFVIGDDLVTTKDSNIEACAKSGEINASLIKANQIGTLSETVLAMLTSLAYGCDLVVSHRSKSPNDPFEAEIATAMNALGLKAGGGANTERLQKYGRVMEILALAEATSREVTDSERAEAEKTLAELARTLTGRDDVQLAPDAAGADITSLMLRMLAIEAVSGTEVATNAGIPSGRATLFLGRSGIIRFDGATPLGTSAGIDEAIHYVDSIIEPGDLTRKYADLFEDAGDGTYRFGKAVGADQIRAKNDDALSEAWRRAGRYEGKGCMAAVEHIEKILAVAFTGKRLADLGTLLETDRELLELERREAVKAGRIAEDAPAADQTLVMQRKGVLGMNAILSMSLALGRAIAARDGRELWQLIRDMAADTMAGFVAANTTDDDKKNADKLKEIDFEELKSLFRETAKGAIEQDKAIYELLREQLPVYTTA